MLQRGYHITAGRLVASGHAEVDLDALAGQLPKRTLAWIMERRLELEQEAALREASGANDDADGGGGGGGGKLANGSVYLRRAVERGMQSLVQQLLHKGARPESGSELCELLVLCGPMLEAGTEVARLLLDACCIGVAPPVLVAEDEDAGSAAAAAAAAAGVASLSLSQSQDEPPFKYDTLGPAIFEAAAAGWHRLLLLLLERSPVDRDWQGGEDGKKCTPLWIATANRRLECVVALLNAGASPELANKKGSTPLINSCQKNHCAGVGALLAAGASVVRGPNAEDNSPIFVCCRLGRPEILHQILTHLTRTRGRAAVKRELLQVRLVGRLFV